MTLSPSTRASGVAVVGLAACAIALLAWAGGERCAGALRALVVVGLLGGAAFAFLRRGRAATPPVVAVVERHALGRDTGVAVVSAGARRLVVGYGPAGVRLLGELEHGAERAP